MIQNICDYYRENLFMQASGLDFYYGYRIKVKGNISVD